MLGLKLNHVSKRGHKPLSKLMLAYSNWTLRNKFQCNFNQNNFDLTKLIWKCCLQNGSHFVWASMCSSKNYQLNFMKKAEQITNTDRFQLKTSCMFMYILQNHHCMWWHSKQKAFTVHQTKNEYTNRDTRRKFWECITITTEKCFSVTNLAWNDKTPKPLT